MIERKTSQQVAGMRAAGAIVGDTLRLLRQMAQPGVTLRDLDRAAEAHIRKAGGKPTFKGYGGFPASLCLSVNEQVVHGIPSSRKLVAGDVLSIDCGVTLGGLVGDAALTLVVGQTTPQVDQLIAATRQALYAGIAAAKVGAKLGDIGAAIEAVGTGHGFGVVREYCGHGVGKILHEDPQVPNHGPAGSGPRIESGWCLALEPMFCLGSAAVRTLPDGWTVVTHDGKPSAHFEHSIAITNDGVQILTLTSAGEEP